MYETKPWLKFYGDVPPSLDYPETTMSEAVLATAEEKPGAVAYDFLGSRATYSQLAHEIRQCAAGLAALGLKEGDRITISMPTSPQGIICFYAANLLGAVASMIHPLSPVREIEFYLNLSKSRFALTLDAFYPNFAEATENTPLERLVLARIPDYLSLVKRIGFNLTKGWKIRPVPKSHPHGLEVTWWKEMMTGGYPEPTASGMGPDDLAVILYSGGTTGKPKGIMLSNRNFISEGMMVSSWCGMNRDDSILAILPIFHGFGLGVCINAAFMGGGRSILVPTFTPAAVARLIKFMQPSLLVGVPTLYEALNRDPVFQTTDLSCLRATFSGADTLPRPVKERFEEIVAAQGGNVQLLEGYGLTEAVTAIMATPIDQYREGSVGVPFPDMLAKVADPETLEERPCGEEGEICVSGPAVMLGYLDQPEETAQVLKTHADGNLWLHTGDIGTMDEDGFFYFKLRAKRMIKSSGFNVYPAQVEEVLYSHPEVKEACVIGVPDQAQVERVKGFVVLEEGAEPGPDKEAELIAHCQENLIKWSCPREIEFKEELPKTLVGKVAFNVLAQEEKARLEESGE